MLKINISPILCSLRLCVRFIWDATGTIRENMKTAQTCKSSFFRQIAGSAADLFSISLLSLLLPPALFFWYNMRMKENGK